MGKQDDHLPLTSRGLPFIEVNGKRRILAAKAPKLKCGLPRFAELHEVLPREQWKAIDLTDTYKVSVKDQGDHNACVGFSIDEAAEYAWLQSGRAYQEFNPFFIYGLINGNEDAGAIISDGLEEMKKFGVCEKDKLPDGLIFKKDFPQSAFDNALNYLITDAYHCVTFDEICTALVKGHTVPLGILIGKHFADLDNEGVAPLPDGYGGGHALCGVGLKYTNKHGWLIKVQNHWTTEFGLNGFCYITEQHFANRLDAFAVKAFGDNKPAVNNEVPVAIEEKLQSATMDQPETKTEIKQDKHKKVKKRSQ